MSRKEVVFFSSGGFAPGRFALQGVVGQDVGRAVLFAGDVEDLDLGELLEQGLGPVEEGDELRVLDAVLKKELIGEELAVAFDGEMVRGVLQCLGQAGQEALVLGDVVGGSAEETGEFLQDPVALVQQDGAKGRGAGVSPGSAVHVEGQAFSQIRIRPQCSQETTSSPWRTSANR